MIILNTFSLKKKLLSKGTDYMEDFIPDYYATDLKFHLTLSLLSIYKKITITCKKLNILSRGEISSRLPDPELKFSSQNETSFFSI